MAMLLIAAISVSLLAAASPAANFTIQVHDSQSPATTDSLPFSIKVG
jgi:hypothetical protein